MNIHKNGRSRYLAAFLCTAVFMCSCGLDTFYYVDSPVSDGHLASISSDDEIYNYFSCRTTEEDPSENALMFGSAECTFLGTEIYYKIYNSTSLLNSTKSAVDSMSSDTASASSAAAYLIDTRGYKPLKLSEGSVFPLIKAGNVPKNRFVYIRLTPSGSSDPEPICVSETSSITAYTPGSELYVNGSTVFPRRYIDSSKGFCFGSDDGNPEPLKTDEDVSWSEGAGEEGVWYVDMYAVSLARDINYTLQYSRPYSMGSVAIKVQSE